MPYWTHDWTHGWWMIIWWLFVFGGITWLVWITARSSVQSARTDEGASDVLRRRFAAGEIDEPEYRERLAALRGAV